MWQPVRYVATRMQTRCFKQRQALTSPTFIGCAGLQKLMEGFTDDDTDLLAESSYAYWLVAKLAPDQVPKDARKHAILKEIRRHYIGEARVENQVLASIQAALVYRREFRVGLMRLCFYADLQKRWGLTDEEQEFIAKTEEMVRGEQSRQQMIVRGSAKEIPIAFKPHRLTPTTADEDESYVVTQIYLAERAFAVAEFNTLARNEKLLVVFYFKDYMSGHSVTTTASKRSSASLQKMYPERLKKFFICDPPFFLRFIINIILLIVSSATREKIELIIGLDKLVEEFAELTGDENSKVVQMLKDGDYASSADNETFLTVVPFYRYYDDIVTE